MNLPQRKPQRLKGFDYSQNNAYFVTICTQDRLHLFGEIIDNALLLNHAGVMVEEKLLNISNGKHITIEKHVIMPNHIHAIIIISHIEHDGTIKYNGMTEFNGDYNGTTQGSFPTVSYLVQQFKMITTRLYVDGVKNGMYDAFNKRIWQKSFHDHIIRNESEYQKIWRYIDENPAKWAEDCYYEENNTSCNK